MEVLFQVIANEYFEFPGYKRATLLFENIITKKQVECVFMISPSSIQDGKSINAQIDKTLTGWFASRSGASPSTISTSGYFLDTSENNERLDFLDNFSNYMLDKQNSHLEFVNEWKQTFIIEGRQYFGFMQSISLSKNSMMPFIYAYNMSFMYFRDFKIHHSKDKRDDNSTLNTSSAMSVLSGGKSRLVDYNNTPQDNGSERVSLSGTINDILTSGGGKS